MQKVLLQTLIVKVRGNGQNKFVRCLIDTGSQKSYILKFVAEIMQYISESNIIHSLFGGMETSEIHKQFIVYLSNLKSDYKCNFKA